MTLNIWPWRIPRWRFSLMELGKSQPLPQFKRENPEASLPPFHPHLVSQKYSSPSLVFGWKPGSPYRKGGERELCWDFAKRYIFPCFPGFSESLGTLSYLQNKKTEVSYRTRKSKVILYRSSIYYLSLWWIWFAINLISRFQKWQNFLFSNTSY